MALEKKKDRHWFKDDGYSRYMNIFVMKLIFRFRSSSSSFCFYFCCSSS